MAAFLPPRKGKVKEKDLLSFSAGGLGRSGSLGAYLADENRTLTEQLVFGVISSQETAPGRLDLLRLWWVPGTRGCLSVNGQGGGSGLGLLPGHVRARMPPGLEVCPTPESLQAKAWYSEDRHGTHRGALLPLILRLRFPDRRW